MTLKEGKGKVKKPGGQLAFPLLNERMISLESALQIQFKSTRQILVRFAHAPCVKLTLEARAAVIPSINGVRILRLQKSAPFSR